jgi:hypothetical protein
MPLTPEYGETSGRPVLVSEHVVAGVIVRLIERALTVLDFAQAAQRGGSRAIDGDRLVGVTRLASRLIAGLSADAGIR